MNHIDVMKQALEALEEIALAGMSGSGQESEEGMRDWHARQAWKFIGIAARALDHLREALAAPGNQLADINEALAAPNSVDFDGIKTESAQQEPALRLKGVDEYGPLLDWYKHWTDFPVGTRFYAAQHPAPQQDPDALHLAAMDLARKQMDRIAELEAEVIRFRTDAMNEKAARQALEQQLAARVPLSDDRIKLLWEKSTGQKLPNMGSSVWQLLAVARAIEAAHGITKGTA